MSIFNNSDLKLNKQFINNAFQDHVDLINEIDEDLKSARVVVKDSQLSLAIGKEGQNARLAAKLTGYKIDIEGLGDSPQEDIEETEEAKNEEE